MANVQCSSQSEQMERATGNIFFTNYSRRELLSMVTLNPSITIIRYRLQQLHVYQDNSFQSN